MSPAQDTTPSRHAEDTPPPFFFPRRAPGSPPAPQVARVMPAGSSRGVPVADRGLSRWPEVFAQFWRQAKGAETWAGRPPPHGPAPAR
jgi:hypothetical protein